MKAAVGALSKLGQLESLDFLDNTVSLFGLPRLDCRARHESQQAFQG